MDTKTLILLMSLISVIFAAGPTSATEDQPVPFTELRVTQFADLGEATLHPMTSAEFKTAAQQSCSTPTGQQDPVPAAPLVAAFGGIALDWLFSRALARISESLKKRIKEHSSSYSNRPVFRDMFVSNQWTRVNETCVIMQRIECRATAESVKTGSARCGNADTVALSVGIKLRNQGNLLRVLPFALNLQQLKPKHHKGKATVAAAFRIEAIGLNSVDAAGFTWKSTEIPIGSLACDVSKNRIPIASCTQTYALSENRWLGSNVIPMPPKAAQALVFSIGEVGEPSQGLKGFSAFLDANQGNLSGALSEAFQKKIKLSEQ